MKKIFLILIVLIGIFLVSYISADLIKKGGSKSISDRVAIIPIYGAITTTGNPISVFEQRGTPSNVIIDFISRANKDPTIKGIILEINSPGGTVIGSKDIGNAVKESKKPVVAWIREIGTSGGYWIASASDSVVADPMSITGSIGVIGSYLEFSRLLEEYGVTYQQLTSGKYKDTGSPFKELSNDERALLQTKIDIIHNNFVSEVAANRKLSIEQVNNLATGIFYLGVEAKDLGLVDILGGKEEAIDEIKRLSNLKEATLVSYQRKTSIIDALTMLSSNFAYYIGKGLGTSFYQNIKSESYYVIPTV